MIRSVLKFFGLHKEAAPASTAPLAVPYCLSSFLSDTFKNMALECLVFTVSF